MKKFMALLLTGAMVASLVGCGNKAATENSASEAVTETTEAATETTEAEATTEAAAETTETTAEAGALTGELKLGFIGPLTGAAAIYGNAADNGAKIAVEEINAISPDFQISFNDQDDEHDAEKSVNAYNNLKDAEVQAIVGCVTTTPCIAVGAEAQNDNMFMLTPSASSPDAADSSDTVFQLCFADPNQGSASAKYIKDNALAEKVAVIYNNSDAYSTGIYNTFVEEAASVGLEVVSETTFTDDTQNDFSVQLKEAQDAGAELVFLPIYYTPASLIFQQANTMGYAPKFFGVDGMDGILTLEGFDTSLAEGVMLLTPFAADATDDATKNFVEKFNAATGETPSQFAADGYDCVYAIYKALQVAAGEGLDVTGMSYSDICDLLKATFADSSFSVDGITGLGMTWTPDGAVNKEPKAVVIENGVYVGL